MPVSIQTLLNADQTIKADGELFIWSVSQSGLHSLKVLLAES